MLHVRRAAIGLVSAAAIAASAFGAANAHSEPFLGQVSYCAFDFCPRRWGLADGAQMPINQNTAVFSLLGARFGGNGATTFALPDLRGRAPVSQGTGPGVTGCSIGEAFGAETTKLTVAQLPAHSHNASTKPRLRATSANGPIGAPLFATIQIVR